MKKQWTNEATAALCRKLALFLHAGVGVSDGLALLADCITLTPGTITLDVIKEDDVISMYVQWLIMESEDAEEAGEIIKGRMEKWIGRIFG